MSEKRRYVFGQEYRGYIVKYKSTVRLHIAVWILKKLAKGLLDR